MNEIQGPAGPAAIEERRDELERLAERDDLRCSRVARAILEAIDR